MKDLKLQLLRKEINKESKFKKTKYKLRVKKMIQQYHKQPQE